jgi:hypothetical protein
VAYAGALPPGMAAVDAGLAECIEDAFAVGYTDESLSKLLLEAISYIPPGSSIQVAGAGGAGDGGGGLTLGAGQVGVSEQQLQQLLQLQAQGLIPGAGGPGGPMQMPVPMRPGMPGMFPGMAPMGGMPMFGGMGGPMPGMMGPGFGMPGMPGMGGPGGGFGGPGMPGMGGPPGAGAPGGPALPPGVPPPPGTMGGGGAPAEGGDVEAFSTFMNAFRTEMRQARDQGTRLQKFVPSAKTMEAKRLAAEKRANEVFGVGIDDGTGLDDELQNAEDFDEWPDEFLLLGVAEQDGQQGSSPSPDSDTSTTSETASTEGTEETDEEDEDDAWPIEMLIG